MQATGIQTPVGVKVTGPDVAVVEDLSRRVESLLRDLPGTKSVIAERISAGYYLDVQNDLQRMAEHGVTVDEAMATIRYGIGGDNIAAGANDGGHRSAEPAVLARYIDTLDKVRHAPVVTADGRAVPLGDVADVAVRKMPEMLRNDNGKLSGYIYVDVEKLTGPDYVEAARLFLANNVTLPTGYSIEWTGLYRYAAAARARLKIVVPLTLLIIVGCSSSHSDPSRRRSSFSCRCLSRWSAACSCSGCWAIR